MLKTMLICFIIYFKKRNLLFCKILQVWKKHPPSGRNQPKNCSKWILLPLQSAQCPVSPLNGGQLNISTVKFVSEMLRRWCCNPPGLVCNTFPCNLSLSTLFYTLLCNLEILYQKPNDIATLFPLWKELLQQDDAVEKHMSAQRSRICAIRASGCAVCSAVHCARIDFLWRPSWQIPPPGSRVPRDPLRKLSRNFKGSRLSRPAAAPLRFWMDGHDPEDKKTEDDSDDKNLDNYDAVGILTF